MTDLKPMLACKDASKIRFPVLASPKLDGIRALVKDGVVLSRTLKPIPNKHVQKLFGRWEFNGYDGELIVGDPTSKDVYRTTVSGVMSEDGEPDVCFFAFDRWDMPENSFSCRYDNITASGMWDLPLARLHHRIIEDQEELGQYERVQLEFGYEGVMVRDPNGKYKYGRSTAKEGYLTKVKRFEDAEAVVIGVEELMHNDNEAKLDELGHTKRSSHKENKRPAGMLGALVCRTPEGVEFNIGTGFDEATRREIWAHQAHYAGKTVKYKFFPVGVKEAPRHPVFLGFRPEGA